MFGPIPMFGDARPPMIGNSTAANNIDGSVNNENINDLNNNEQTFETMNRAAL